MELSEIKKYKKDVEAEISNLVTKFSDETGIRVSDIIFKDFVKEPLGGGKTFSGYKSMLDIKIDWN